MSHYYNLINTILLIALLANDIAFLITKLTIKLIFIKQQCDQVIKVNNTSKHYKKVKVLFFFLFLGLFLLE